jgi:ribose transport system permease protein
LSLEFATRLRHRYWPDHVLGEILSKRWTETAIPVILLVLTYVLLSRYVQNFISVGALVSMSRQAGEIGLVVMGLSLVMIVGGIDLSVGSMFALTNFVALLTMNVWGWSTLATVTITLFVGALLGAVNGILIGYVRLRAFLTTLITLIVYRAAYDLAVLQYSTAISSNPPDSEAWNWLGEGKVLGIPAVAAICIVIAIFGHVFLTRMRWGWHVIAIGGLRRSAFNSGIAVRRTVASCYVASGVLTAAGAICFASRLSTAGGDVGAGLEVTALTAAVVGGIRLGGGNGSVTKALAGTLIVLGITNGLISLAVPGGVNRMVLATILVVSAIIDIRWIKNRYRIISKVYVSPSYLRLPKAPSARREDKTPYAINDTLEKVELIGLGRIEGPEDVILDRNDHLYCGSRHGDIVRFFPPDYERMEVFAHIGGQPLGLGFDKDDNLYVCIGGMGLYRVAPDGSVTLATDETNRSWMSVNDDSRLRLTDNLDFAPDGRVFFSEASTRYEMHEWAVDGLEARGNGRIICYDPRANKTHTVLRGLVFPNGIAMASDGQSFLFAETWACKLNRYWFDGPNKGMCKVLIPNLPGLPDNINRASDGNFWIALTGMRSPAFDLALRLPGFRKRMAARLPPDEWMYPNINIGCIIKVTEDGEVLDALWDPDGKNHPSITSAREHKGHLYIGGLENNRIGRYKLPSARQNYVEYDTYWEGASFGRKSL